MGNKPPPLNKTAKTWLIILGVCAAIGGIIYGFIYLFKKEKRFQDQQGRITTYTASQSPQSASDEKNSMTNNSIRSNMT